jgi:hypothetical protein
MFIKYGYFLPSVPIYAFVLNPASFNVFFDFFTFIFFFVFILIIFFPYRQEEIYYFVIMQLMPLIFIQVISVFKYLLL